MQAANLFAPQKANTLYSNEPRFALPCESPPRYEMPIPRCDIGEFVAPAQINFGFCGSLAATA